MNWEIGKVYWSEKHQGRWKLKQYKPKTDIAMFELIDEPSELRPCGWFKPKRLICRATQRHPQLVVMK